MTGHDEFAETVRAEIAGILSRKYTTVRHGGHDIDRDEFRRERTFWPDMTFHGVALSRPAGRDATISLTFTPVYEPENTYGFRIDMPKAVVVWSKRVGIRDPLEHPAMFAAELIWYMVTYIGAIEIADSASDESGIRWINDGSEIFEALPGAEDHEH